MESWQTDDNDEIARALANLNLPDSSGYTWEELIERLISPTTPSEGVSFGRNA